MYSDERATTRVVCQLAVTITSLEHGIIYERLSSPCKGGSVASYLLMLGGTRLYESVTGRRHLARLVRVEIRIRVVVGPPPGRDTTVVPLWNRVDPRDRPRDECVDVLQRLPNCVSGQSVLSSPASRTRCLDIRVSVALAGVRRRDGVDERRRPRRRTNFTDRNRAELATLVDSLSRGQFLLDQCASNRFWKNLRRQRGSRYRCGTGHKSARVGSNRCTVHLGVPVYRASRTVPTGELRGRDSLLRPRETRRPQTPR